MKQPVICRSPEVMGGTAVFYGTRVPVQTLLDYLEAGDTIDDFLEGFPSVTRERVIAFLEEAKDQDIISFSIAVVVLQARTNRLADLRPLVPSLLSAIEATPPGTAKFIGQS
jgi:uncharacterized protein (DUF433 family)